MPSQTTIDPVSWAFNEKRRPTGCESPLEAAFNETALCDRLKAFCDANTEKVRV